MSGFVGIVNLKQNLSKQKDVIIDMNDTLKKRGPDECGYYTEDNVLFGHRRLITIDPHGGKEPMSFKYNEQIYTIVFDGNIYNKDELKKELEKNGFTFETYSDTEVLLKAYIHYKEDVIHKINGVFAFAIWNTKDRTLFIARDHFCVKPLYYTLFNNNFIFASEIKAILKFPGIEPILDKQGICELLGIGPSHTSGITAFKNIYEIKPANFIIYNDSGIHINRYWKLNSKPHTDSLGRTRENIRFLIEDSIKKQLICDAPLCTFLSGGLDSSIITLYASNYCKENRASSS